MLTVIMLLTIAGLFLLYRAATAPATGPGCEEGGSEPDYSGPLYHVQVQDWVLGAKAWVSVFSGSLTACERERDQMYTHGHNKSTCRIVQVV